MSEPVGRLFYEVTFETRQLIEGRRRIESETDKAARSFNVITKAVQVYAATLALLKMAEVADDFKLLQTRVNVASKSIGESADNMDRLRKISTETRSALADNVQVFTRLNPAITQMGGNAKDTLRIVDLLSKAITVSGATAAEKSSAMIQFGQALGSGKLAGDELRSLLENAPYLMKQLADGLGVPIGALKSLGEQGKLTADVVVNALGKATDKINKDFAQFPQTVAGALQVTKDQVTRLVAELDKAGGKNAALVGVLQGVGQVVDELANRLVNLNSKATETERNDAIKTWADRTSAALGSVLQWAQLVGVTLAGAIAGKFVQSIATSTAAMLESVQASRAATLSEAARLETVRAGTAVMVLNADVARAAALATAEKAAVNLTAAQSEVALAAAEVERAALQAALARGTQAQVVQQLVAKLATDRLTAAKSAETVATAALAEAETVLAAARSRAFAAAAEEAVATTAVTTAQRANTVAATLAGAASRTFGTVITALGGPIGVAIIAIGALALKFSSVKTAAEEAADIAEKAAGRIARASSRSVEAPMRELMNVRDEAQKQMADLDAQISRAEKWARSGRGPQPSDADVGAMTSDLVAKREAARGALLASQKAIDDMKAQQLAGGGEEKPSVLKSPVDPEVARKQTAQRAAARAYYEGLLADTQTGLAKIAAEEQKALAENDRRMAEAKGDGGTTKTLMAARLLIVQKFQKETAALEEAWAKDRAATEIAITTDEQERIIKIREEAFRAANAEQDLGVKTAEQAENAKRVAIFQTGQMMLDLADRNARARAEQQLAEIRDATERIRITEAETISALALARARGRITDAEYAAGVAKAKRQTTDDTRTLNRGRDEVAIDTLQLKAGAGGVEDQVALIRADAAKRLKATMEAQEADLANAQAYADQRVAINEDMERRIEQTRAQSTQNALNSTANAFDALVQATQSGTGKQDAIYKAAFIAQKAFAIASSIVAIQTGVAQAASLPWPANLGAMASVIAATASIISTIKGTNYGGGRQYGGPVSAGSMYRVNETGRPEMFTASNGSQYMMPTASGNVTPADQVSGQGGGKTVNMYITQNFTVQQGTSTQTQAQMATAAARGLQQALARNG